MKKITRELVVSKLPRRPSDANKGTFGKALVIAGSKNYPGAAILSCLACARSGAGLVALATDEDVYKVVVPKIPFATFLKFSEIKNDLEKCNAILIGPGLGQSDEIKKFIREFIGWKNLQNKKIVVDADALNILSNIDDWFKVLNVDAVLTPHPGEMSRLTKITVGEVQKNREKLAEEFARKWRKTIILKGANTVIARPKGEIFISPFANPLLATAGSGDVFAGIITGLLAQGLNLTDAAIAGVYIHGLAGEKLKEKFGDRGAVATDLIETLPEVLKNLSQQQS